MLIISLLGLGLGLGRLSGASGKVLVYANPDSKHGIFGCPWCGSGFGTVDVFEEFHLGTDVAGVGGDKGIIDGGAPDGEVVGED